MIDDLSKFMKKVAEEIEAKFLEYDQERSVVICPVKGGRIQTVYGTIKSGDKYGGKTGIEFTSKVCSVHDIQNPLDMIKAQSENCHAKFVVYNEEVWVEACAYLESATEGTLREMVVETAQTADTWELKITGLDVN